MRSKYNNSLDPNLWFHYSHGLLTFLNRFHTNQLSKQAFFLGRLLLVGVAALSCSLGPVLVQIVGWATMIPKEFSQTNSLNEAIEKTFSGEHPCTFCKLATELNAPNTTSDEDESKPSEPSQNAKKKNTLFAQNSLARPLISRGLGARRWLHTVLAPAPVHHELVSPPPQSA